MTLQFGVFDHIEPIPDVPLDRLYRERLLQVERFDAAGFYAYHLTEYHTPGRPQSGSLPECVSRGGVPAHAAATAGPVYLRPAAASPAPAH